MATIRRGTTPLSREIGQLLYDRLRPIMIRWVNDHDEPFDAEQHVPDLPYMRIAATIDVECANVTRYIDRAHTKASRRLDEIQDRLGIGERCVRIQ